ncbi:MAG: PHP domain-containing protein [Candidatus Helarchaeota archaeon]
MIDYHIHSYFSDGDQTIDEIISTAARRNLSAIAITDHCDTSGKFLYIRDTKPPRPLTEYISEIRSSAEKSPLKVYLGIEVTGFSNSETLNYPSAFNLMDFILVETFFPQNPYSTKFDPIKYAIQLKHKLKIPVGLAHPTITHIENNFELIKKHDIFIELNSDKLISNPSEKKQIFDRLLDLLKSSKIKISVGSDAHIIFLIGGVRTIWEFIQENNLESRLILTP